MSLIEVLGWAVTAIAVAGVVMNNHRLRLCFVLWFFSNGLSAAIHFNAGIASLAVRDLVFLVLAIHGLIAWSRSRKITSADMTEIAPAQGTEAPEGPV